jgi:hypothetical protein
VFWYGQALREKTRFKDLKLSLYVRWFSPTGKTKVNRLLLRPVTSVEALQVTLHAPFVHPLKPFW